MAPCWGKTPKTGQRDSEVRKWPPWPGWVAQQRTAQAIRGARKHSRYAAYLDAWRARIEAIGTQHCSDEARGRICSGSLRITVSVPTAASPT